MNAKNSDFGTFAQDTVLGLSSSPKMLSSKYFYDDKGDKLFQKIMNLPEYYLTKKEFEILENYHQEILSPVLKSGEPFNLVELGAGDGLKTKILLRYLMQIGADFTYFPIDFSGSVLQELKASLAEEMPELKVEFFEDSYRVALRKRAWENGNRSLIIFLGSNLGNFLAEEALEILDHLKMGTEPSDFALIGFDLKKNPATILSAYNDSEEVTKEFNLNLLRRMNKDFEADFDLSSFIHWPTYDPITGECRSYLISLKEQVVTMKLLDQHVHFDAYESIFMEVSKKYSLKEIDNLASRSGFKVSRNFLDADHYFSDVLWERI
jgi:dimethylhistidine N-methyltransferase